MHKMNSYNVVVNTLDRIIAKMSFNIDISFPGPNGPNPARFD